MSAQAQAILEQALRLSADERADLADALQRSLEEGGASNLPPEEVARLWNEEIERRLVRARERVARGSSTGRTADEVYAEAEAKLHAMRAQRTRMKQVRFEDAADDELIDEVVRYELRRDGLGPSS